MPTEEKLRHGQALLKNIRAIQPQEVLELRVFYKKSENPKIRRLLEDVIAIVESSESQPEPEYFLSVWRNALDLSQQDLARLANVSKSDISQKEKPGVNIRKATAEQLAQCLGISLEQLRRRPTPRDLRRGRMASIAQAAGRESAIKAKRKEP